MSIFDTEVEMTLQSLQDIWGVEKQKPELCKLPDGFFEKVKAYLKMKEDHIIASNQKQDMFTEGEVKRTSDMVKSARKTMVEIGRIRKEKITRLIKIGEIPDLQPEEDYSIIPLQEFNWGYDKLWKIKS